MPTVNEGEEANCRILPLCSEAGTGDCFASPTGLVQLSDDKGDKFAYPKSNGFDLPELPECTGLNGHRKVDCRQIGRYTTVGNWFVQTDASMAKEEKDDSPNYKTLNAGTPHLPECTGMNGDRKGPGTDCR